MSRTILVTGASGFAGGHLVEYLTTRGSVTAWSRSSPPAALATAATWQRIDLHDRQAVREAIARLRPAQVYHCAGSPHVAHSWQDTATPLANNVIGTHHLLEALGAAGGPARILIPGSGTIYAPSSDAVNEAHPLAPSSPYAVSKLAQEQLGLRAILEDRLEVIVTRSFNHTGPRQAAAFAAPSMARQIARIERGEMEPVLKMGNLAASRDFTDVRDVVRAYALLMERGVSGTIYNVASGVGRTIQSLLDGLLARSRVPVRVERDPALMRPNDVPVLVGDPSRLKAATGWTPEIEVDRMLDDLLTYWRSVP